MSRGCGPYARQVAGWNICKKIRRTGRAVPLKGRRDIGFRAFLESAKIGDQASAKNLVAHPCGDSCREPNPSCAGFGPAGFHLLASSPRGGQFCPQTLLTDRSVSMPALFSRSKIFNPRGLGWPLAFQHIASAGKNRHNAITDIS